MSRGPRGAWAPSGGAVESIWGAEKLLHLGETDWGAPPSPPPPVTALHYQPTKGLTHSTVESLWFSGMTKIKILKMEMKMKKRLKIFVR